MKRIAILMLLALPVAAAGWTPRDFLRAKTITDVRPSPDGSRVTFTVTEQIATEDKNELLRQVWIAKSDGSEAMPLTFGDKSSFNATWLPDGSGIIFMSLRSGRAQLYVLRLHGGEAEPLPTGKLELATYAIAPDGASIAMTASEPNPDDEKRAKTKEDYYFVDEDVRPRCIYVIPLGTKGTPRKLTNGDDVASSLAWSPDSKSIAYSTAKTVATADWITLDVKLVNIASGETRTLAATNRAETGPLFSPDGKWITYISSEPRWPQAYRIDLVRLDGTEHHQLPETYDAAPDVIGFSADGKQLLFAESRDLGNRLYSIDVNNGSIAELSHGDEVFGDLAMSDDATHLAIVMQSSDKPVELFVTRTDRFAPQQITHINDDLLKMPIPKTEIIHWKSTDGTDIDGTLTYPLDYQPGKRVPLLLNVHGGPAQAHHAVFAGAYTAFPAALYASKGFAMLRPNPRGTSGYGRKFRVANVPDWGGGDYNDLMTGVDELIKRGIADPDRLAVAGWSYGGYMTDWIVGHTNRFKAAVSGAGISDLLSFSGTSDIPTLIPDYLASPFWQNAELWRARTPINYVTNMKTPMLLIHGEVDERVPTAQSYELYRALKDRGVPVRMLVMPRSHHNPTEPKMRLEVVTAASEWIEKWIK
jgi:dipeptidyl aminopeptidase/acylaminoacyl peptidase